MLLEELRPQIGELRNRLGELKTGLKIEPKKERIQDLDYQMAAPGFWDDPDKAQKVAQEANNLKSEVDTFTSLETKVDDLDTLWEMAMEEKDDTLVSEMESELEGAKHTLSELELGMLLSDEYDANNAIMNLHAGAGGTEAQDWTGMLLRMFTRYAEGKGFEVELLDVLPGEEAGTKSATLAIKGHNAYGFLKSEKGVHRLVRISPFDSNARRHTSFAAVDVMPEIDNTVEVNINMDDVRVDYYRASGAGGQHVEEGRAGAADTLVDVLRRIEGGVEVVMQVFLGDTDTAGAVGLGVTVHQQHALFHDGQCGGKVDGGGRLADAAFLVGYGNNLCIHNFTSFLSKFRYEKKCLLYLS